MANSGHFNDEINITAMDELSTEVKRVRPFVDQYKLEDGRSIYLLGEGRLINLAAAEGHPAAVMDMSFANQALSAEYIAKHHAELERRVYDVPEDIDQGGRPAQARGDAGRDRQADAGAGGVPGLLGERHLGLASCQRQPMGRQVPSGPSLARPESKSVVKHTEELLTRLTIELSTRLGRWAAVSPTVISPP